MNTLVILELIRRKGMEKGVLKTRSYKRRGFYLVQLRSYNYNVLGFQLLASNQFCCFSIHKTCDKASANVAVVFTPFSQYDGCLATIYKCDNIPLDNLGREQAEISQSSFADT
jgi:hypothetical protein